MTNKEKNRIKNAKSKEYRTSYKKKIYQQCREYCWEYKRTHPCMHCGEKHPACLSFHHRDPSTKDGDVTYLCKYGMKRVLAEIAKCDILCHNCHAKVHYNEGHAVT